MEKPVRSYVIRQGDHLEALAVKLHFDADAVWKDPKNADMRKLRKSPAILCPGDILYLPDPKIESLPVTLGATNSYTAKIPTVPLKIAMKGSDGKPLVGQKYVIEGLGAPIEGTTDGSGLVSEQIPATTPSCRLVFKDAKLSYVINVGHLDPVTEDSGVRQRLEHLGFLGSPLDRMHSRPPSLERAIRAYQSARGLQPTGTLDDKTRDALEKEHGV
jgi:hypothetical protein